MHLTSFQEIKQEDWIVYVNKVHAHCSVEEDVCVWGDQLMCRFCKIVGLGLYFMVQKCGMMFSGGRECTVRSMKMYNVDCTVRITYSEGSVQYKGKPVQCWECGHRRHNVRLSGPSLPPPPHTLHTLAYRPWRCSIATVENLY